MALPTGRNKREFDKFVEDGSGNVTVRATIEGTTGDLTVNGDLTVTGSSSIGVDETVGGTLAISSEGTAKDNYDIAKECDRLLTFLNK